MDKIRIYIALLFCQALSFILPVQAQNYGARWMDAAIGRWHVIDPLCEKYYDVSPYAYCAGDPVNRVDINGDSISIAESLIPAIYTALKDIDGIKLTFKNGERITEEFMQPYDDEDTYPIEYCPDGLYGKLIQGNLGQSFFPSNVVASGKSSIDNNIRIIINGKGSLNQNVDNFVYGRSTLIKKNN